jgi:hypothetical protein
MNGMWWGDPLEFLFYGWERHLAAIPFLRVSSAALLAAFFGRHPSS